MRDRWIDMALSAAAQPADFYSGCRKILRPMTYTFKAIKPDLVMADAGYTKSKMTMLKKSYIHEESRANAQILWTGRLQKKKYGSVGFHCFNHYVKGGDHDSKRSKRASVMGPCIQSVSMTLGDDKRTHVDLFYRTTELFKKFPADLVFIRDELLAPFDFSTAPLKTLTFHFANVTCHPMYFVTVIPHLEDPVAELEELKAKDKFFFDWTIKWTARYICEEHSRGIQKFAQALRVQKDALERIDAKTLKKLQAYFRKNHPGHRNSYTDPDAADDDE